MSAWELLAAFLIMAAGGCLQGAVGFGSNLIAAPLLLLVDESYVPVAGGGRQPGAQRPDDPCGSGPATSTDRSSRPWSARCRAPSWPAS